MSIGANIAAKALSHVGEHEQPMGSNAGPEVSKYLAYVGLKPGNPWCAAFACFCVGMMLEQMGLHWAHPQTGSTHAILRWGEDNGMVVHGQPQPGDIGCIIYDKVHGHTVICVADPPGADVATVEGNYGDKVSNNRRRVASCTWIRPYKAPPGV